MKAEAYSQMHFNEIVHKMAESGHFEVTNEYLKLNQKLIHTMVEAEIEQNIANNKVMVYSKSSCPFCVRTKALLQEKGAAFKVIELDQLGNGA